MSWASTHTGEGIQRMADEVVLATGDGNLVEAMATLRYAIDRPTAFLYHSVDITQLLRAVTESAMRELAASRSFADLLTTGRAAFESDALAIVRKRLAEYGDLGVHVDGLSVHDLHPPGDVVPAYQDVARSMEARDRQINEAEADTIRRYRQAQAEALGIERSAQAASRETVTGALGSQAAFLALEKTRNQLDWSTQALLWLAAAGDAWRSGNAARAFAHYQERRSTLVQAQTSLTDFRLFWTALTQALSGRDKILLDTDRLPGRRNLFLVDPDQFRSAITMPAITERPKGRGERGADGP
jgi:Cu+-exporting ATPase